MRKNKITISEDEIRIDRVGNFTLDLPNNVVSVGNFDLTKLQLAQVIDQLVVFHRKLT